jgi:predicted nuclease with TOPRIM domain
MPASELAMAISSAKTLVDTFKGVLSLHLDSEVKAAIIEAQNQTLQLQNQMFDVLAKFEEQSAENAELKEKLTSIQRSDETKTKYEIVGLYEER